MHQKNLATNLSIKKHLNLIKVGVAVTGIAMALSSNSSMANSSATNYPDRPISWVVPFPPGGAMDAIARVLSRTMSQELGQSIVVENKPGAGGNIGASFVAKAKPDGYTIMIVANGMAVNPALYRNMSYNPIKDFQPISLLAAVPNILVTQAGRSDVNSISDVMRQVKEKPGKYSYASAGVGTSIHLAGALFTYMGKLNMLHVPYKGSGPAVTDLISGQVDYMFDSITSAKPHIESGKLKALAVTTPKRSSTLPNLPTVAESGLAGYALTPWFAAFAPVGTPPAIIEKLNGAMIKAMNTEQVKKTFAAIGAEYIGSSPQELATYLAEETTKWQKIIAETGISVD
jgi:tripartite-type tricarboxylate transporter receptor subunit TctC